MNSAFIACSECGVVLPFGGGDDHTCEHDRWVAYQVDRVRHEIERIDDELRSYLQTARGRFDLWYAERTRLPAA